MAKNPSTAVLLFNGKFRKLKHWVTEEGFFVLFCLCKTGIVTWKIIRGSTNIL